MTIKPEQNNIPNEERGITPLRSDNHFNNERVNEDQKRLEEVNQEIAKIEQIPENERTLRDLEILKDLYQKKAGLLRKTEAEKEGPKSNAGLLESIEEKEAETLNEVAKEILLARQRIARQLLPLDIDIQGIEEVYESQGKDEAEKYLKEIGRDDIAKMKRIAETLGKLIKYVEGAKSKFKDEISEETLREIDQSLDQLREYRKRMLEIDRNVYSDELKLVIEALQKKDLKGLISANQGGVYHKFFEEINDSLDRLQSCFR